MKQANEFKGNWFCIFISVFLIVCLISCGSESPKDISVVSAKMLPYKPGEGGKYVEFCFSRRIETDQKYEVIIKFKPKTSEEVGGSTLVSPMLDPEGPCIKHNVYLAVGRFTDDRTRNIFDEHIRAGNMEYIDIIVRKPMESWSTKEKIFFQARFTKFDE